MSKGISKTALGRLKKQRALWWNRKRYITKVGHEAAQEGWTKLSLNAGMKRACTECVPQPESIKGL